MSDRMMQIGEVAKRVGLSLNTLRHWDEEGLAIPSGRSGGGFRLYTDEDVERLVFIKRFKPLGFGLPDIRDVLAARNQLQHAASSNRAALIARLEGYLAVAEERYKQMRADLADAEAFIGELRDELARVGPVRTGSTAPSTGAV